MSLDFRCFPSFGEMISVSPRDGRSDEMHSSAFCWKISFLRSARAFGDAFLSWLSDFRFCDVKSRCGKNDIFSYGQHMT